jgi:hypothetical protein
MGKRTWKAVAAMLAGTAAFVSSPAHASGEVYITAPPPPLVEYAPAPRHGHIWVPGHWQWAGHRHVWVPGRYIVARAGYYYQQPQWIQNGDRWHYRAGNWSRRDLDRDGIPNRHDRDRDGDGVPNRYDRAPNNPYRR